MCSGPRSVLRGVLAIITIISMLIAVTNYITCYSEEICRFVNALAVEDGKGRVIELRICIAESDRDKLLIASDGIVEDDTKYSFALSYIVTKLTLNLSKSFRVVIEIPGIEETRGPSASVLVASAIMSMTRGTHIEGSTTGTMNIDGGIDAVGGISQKLKAAKEHGIEIIALPVFNYVRLPRHVLKELNVKPAASVLDAYAILTHDHLNLSVPTIIYNDLLHKLFKELYLEFRNATLDIITKHSLNISKYTQEITKLIEESDKLSKWGLDYSAASLVFTSYFKALAVVYKTCSISYRTELVRKASRILNITMAEVQRIRPQTPLEISIYLEIISRAAEALEIVNSTEYKELIPYAYARALSAYGWLRVFKEVRHQLGNTLGLLINYNDILKTTESLEEILKYLKEMLRSYTGNISRVIYVPTIFRYKPRDPYIRALWRLAEAKYLIDRCATFIRFSSIKNLNISNREISHLLKLFILNTSKVLALRSSRLHDLGFDISIPALYLEYANTSCYLGYYDTALRSLVYAASALLVLEFLSGTVHIPDVHLVTPSYVVNLRIKTELLRRTAICVLPLVLVIGIIGVVIALDTTRASRYEVE